MTGMSKLYYKTCREQANMTQEQAVSLLGISEVATLSRYENGHAPVSQDLAAAMVKVYRTPLLASWHVRHTNPDLAQYLPDVTNLITDGDTALQMELAEDDIADVRATVKAILRDGVVDITESEELKTNTMDILATISGLSVRYGRTLAVDNLSFDVRAQEVFAVIGPNGSGKTSAIEVLEGLRLPSDGTVSVFGLSPHSHHKEIYKGLGVQLQDVAYPDKIKVAELCDLFASFYETPADYKRLLEQLDLQDKAKRTVSKLSGGEKQRLSILLALLPRPKLLILDELTTGLDPEVRRGLWEALKAAKKAGVGILLVSHYMDEVETLADRVLFMLKGKPLFNGTLPELRAFAKSKIGDKWSEEMSLEDIYLALIPQKATFELEVGV